MFSPTRPNHFSDVGKSDAQSRVHLINDKIASYLRGNLHEPGVHTAGSRKVAEGVAKAATTMLARSPDRAVEIEQLVGKTLDAVAKSAPVDFGPPNTDTSYGVDIANYFREVPTIGGGSRWEFDLAGFFAAVRTARGF